MLPFRNLKVQKLIGVSQLIFKKKYSAALQNLIQIASTIDPNGK